MKPNVSDLLKTFKLVTSWTVRPYWGKRCSLIQQSFNKSCNSQLKYLIVDFCFKQDFNSPLLGGSPWLLGRTLIHKNIDHTHCFFMILYLRKMMIFQTASSFLYFASCYRIDSLLNHFAWWPLEAIAPASNNHQIKCSQCMFLKKNDVQSIHLYVAIVCVFG